jgi:hypothetical protein
MTVPRHLHSADLHVARGPEEGGLHRRRLIVGSRQYVRGPIWMSTIASR